MREEHRIAAGMAREDVVRAVHECVNQPDTMFSTDHWLLPKLDRLRLLLHDPITGDEASALLDVLYKRHYMRDLLEWLARRTEPWSGFFADREQRNAALLQTDEEWLNSWRKSLTRKQRAQMERKHLAVAQKEYLPIAQPCPRCGLPAEKLKWFRYRSPRTTWVNLCGRAGWKTRCRICRQEIDFFITLMN